MYFRLSQVTGCTLLLASYAMLVLDNTSIDVSSVYDVLLDDRSWYYV